MWSLRPVDKGVDDLAMLLRRSEVTPRQLIESTVRIRATHRTKDEVGDTRSFGNMEQTLTREYWGRFLMELVQNARDAWLAAGRPEAGSTLLVRLTDEPALVVGNQGRPITADVILDSIGKFGESTKSYGEGIGHKGIGFKSVLEITRTPEIYSRSTPESPFDLRVRFDPDAARALVHEMSPDWDDLVRELASASTDDDRGERIPALRFPSWVDESAPWLDDLDRPGGDKLDTLIRLPFRRNGATALGVDRDEFVRRVRRAMDEVSDEIVLLLGVFDRIVLQDRLDPSRDTVIQRKSAGRISTTNLMSQAVDVLRNDSVSSSWELWERRLPGRDGLEGDIAVGIKVERAPGGVMRLAEKPTAGNFHLFFPTRIASRLPLLLQAYFQVDAGRQGFAADQGELNRGLLGRLGELAVDAISDLAHRASSGAIDINGLADAFAQVAGEPDDALAIGFRDTLLARLDSIRWVAAEQGEAGNGFASPAELLADSREPVATHLAKAFPPRYVQARLGLRYPGAGISPAGRAFLAERGRIGRDADSAGVDSATLARLLSPDAIQIWDGDPDTGFRALLDLLDAIRVLDPATEAVIKGARTDPAARIVPVVDDQAPQGRRLRAPGSQPGDASASSGAILARISTAGSTSLAPPASLAIDFLADGLISAELLGSVGSWLGIRPYDTDRVLDTLWSSPDRSDPALVTFLWRLLLRENLSAMSVAAALRASSVIGPRHWYWARDGAPAGDIASETRNRERALGSLRLPAADGALRPASDLAFGTAWADWALARTGAIGSARERAEAWRDLETLAPGPHAILGPPDVIVPMFQLDPGDIPWAFGDNAPPQADQPDALLFAFLLRLGVWEVPPLTSSVDWSLRPEAARDPFTHLPGRAKQREGWAAMPTAFARYEGGHRNIHVAVDHRLAWDIRPGAAFARAIGRGVDLYEDCWGASLFCSNCRHSTRYPSDPSPAPSSYLAHQLGTTAWVDVVEDEVTRIVPPPDAWDADERPDASRRAQSWTRYLPLIPVDFPTEISSLLHITSIDDADIGRLIQLLRSLREQFDRGELVADRRSGSFAGQALVGLHRRLYARLARVAGDDAREIIAEIGVLAELGSTLGFHDPVTVRHDGGEWSALKRHFQGVVPFVTLSQEQGPVADALGVPRLSMTVTRQPSAMELDVTDRTRPFIHERAAELLALQVLHPLAGAALDRMGRAFGERAARLAALKVVQVDNLVLDVAVDGLEVQTQLGSDRDQDIYLAGPTTPKPVLYHDLSVDWEERLRSQVAPHLAAMLDAPVYDALFRLLLQQETDAQRLDFLDEQGVAEQDLEDVAALIAAGGSITQRARARWLEALVPWQAAPGVAEVPYHDDIRRDSRVDGDLARLASLGVDLATLDGRLRSLGDEGLEIHLADDLLRAWRRDHGQAVTAVLMVRDVSDEAAREAPTRWRTSPAARWLIPPPPKVYLAPVVDTLRAVGLKPDPEALASADAAVYLAALVGMTVPDLEALWETHFSAEGRARAMRELAFEWRRIIRPLLVAARTRPGTLPHAIRAEASAIDHELPPSPESSEDIATSLTALLPDRPLLAGSLGDLIRSTDWLSGPDRASAERICRDHLTVPDHLDVVTRTLARAASRRVDQLRGDLEQATKAGLRAVPYEGSAAVAPRPPRRRTEPKHVSPRRKHDQRVRDRLGIEGERWARAVVVNQLLSLERSQYLNAIAELWTLLVEVAKGPIVDELVHRAQEAEADGVDDDDRLDALARFLHVAEESDDFGFDLLGWVAPYPDVEPRAMLLEVKNAKERQFNVSTGEWRRAEEQGDRYAFLIVLRAPSGPPQGLELLPDPARLRADERLSRSEDGWIVGYEPA